MCIPADRAELIFREMVQINDGLMIHLALFFYSRLGNALERRRKRLHSAL